MYVANNAANGWNRDHIRIYVNGTDEAKNWPGQSGQTVTSVNSGTFYITEIRATEITEKFINHTVTFTPPSQGSTSAQIKDGATINSGDEVPEGTQVIFTWEKATGYDFDNFSDGKNTYTQNPCTLPVNSNLNITTNVKVEVPKYDLTVSVNDDNMGTATGTGKYAKDEEVSLTATPNEHCRFVNWTVAGEAVSTEANYTYTMPNKATTIVANFAAIPQYTITFDATTNGGTCATASKDIYAGDAIGTLPEATRDNYNMTGWFDAATGGNQITESTIPTGNVTYYAQFAVAPIVECTKHKELECEDAMIPYDKLTIVNSGVAGPKTATFGNNNERGEYSGSGYMLTVHEDAGSEIYIPLSISGDEQAALTMQIRYANSQDTYSKIRIYKETQESGDIQVTNTGKNYLRISSDKFASSGWQKPFTTATYNKTLDPGNYIIGLWAQNDARFDYIDISTTNDVLCTTTPRYELKLEINDPEKGENATGAGAYTKGALAPINVTAKSGYEFVAWKEGETVVSTDASFNYPMPAKNVTLTAYFDTEVTKHTLTASVADEQSSWGHVDPTTQQVGEGREAQVTAIVDNNQYRFDHWSSTDVELTDQQAKANPLKFPMPTKDVAVVAHFVFDEVHNLIATGTSTNVGSHIDRHSNLDRITITSIADNTGSFQHNVLQYAINFQSTSDYSAYTVPTDANYSANAKATGYAFWYMADDNIYMEFNVGGEHGIVCKLPSTNGAWEYFYVEDATAATATSGFEIWMNYSKDGWGMSSLTGTVLFSEIQATNVTSQEPIVPPVDLTVVVSPDESGTVKTYPATTTGLEKGTEVTLTATPEDNYRFVNWTVNDVEVSTEATYARIVNATETITANFVRVYTLVVNHDEHIASVTGAGQYAEGESVTVTATADQGYKFTNWTEDAGGEELATTSSYTFDMPATDNYTVYANSEEDIVTYHITLGTCPNGTIAATVNDEPYTGGDLTANTPVVLTATPDEGYGFVQWIDGNREITRTIYANAQTQAITWTATFDQIYTVTTEFGKPGSEVTGGGTYPIGGQVTLEAFVSDKDYKLDYNFSHWKQVSGTAPITGHEHDNPLTFTMPAQDLKLKAIYAPVECVDTYIIQCEDGYIEYNTVTSEDQLPYEIPHGGSCGAYHDYYTGYHEAGYYDYKKCTNHAMYYMTKLPAAATYSFSMWIASNSDLTQTLSIYYKDETGASNDLIYHGVHYAKYSQSVSDGNHGPDTWPFKESKALTGYTISQPQDIIICLHATGGESAAFDQIKITANQNVFCHELSTETFTINSGETKEIPVCGVNNLIIYDGGQANNEENVEVKTSVKHIRQVKQLDVWEDFALPFTATSIQVEDPKNHNMYDIYPAIRQHDGDKWTVRAGYFVLEELKHEEKATVIGTEFRQRWEMTINEKPQANTPYILEFTSTQSDGYFKNTYITYGMTGSTEVLGFEDATVDHGSWPTDGTKPTYHYVANNSVVPVYPYDAYVLNDDHTEFVLTDHPEILPFHCYIQASAETKANAPRLRLVGGGSTPTLIPVVEALNVDAEGVFKFIMDDKVYILRNGVLYNAVGQHVK
ncbi:MAG: InlB B-repeat-containing protein [Bacteroidales bacterium]|nr:InlB B-repeat-containing protein [Bacteroidales bacterium]